MSHCSHVDIPPTSAAPLPLLTTPAPNTTDTTAAAPPAPATAPATAPTFQLTDGQREAYDLALQGKSIFITGGAGVGKSAVVKEISRALKQPYILLAPTGIAAFNIGGITIHKFFRLFPSDTESSDESRLAKTVQRVSRNSFAHIAVMQTIIIDEISMVSGRLFSLIDRILQRVHRKSTPFGGVQIIAVGCFYQLPPVPSVSDRRSAKRSPDFAFQHKAWIRLGLQVVYLDEIVRQSNKLLQDCLNDLRIGESTDRLHHLLAEATARDLDENMPQPPVFLFSTNTEKDDKNKRKLQTLPGEEFTFTAEDEGDLSYLRDSLIPTTLHLKIGARIMLLRNDPGGLFFNGSLGNVLDIEANSKVVVQLDALADPIIIERFKLTVDVYNPASKEYEVAAIRNQLPMDLAWATTIHKSQGLTLDKVCVDVKRVFSPGQLYVALSRVTSREGLWVRNWVGGGIKANPTVDDFYLQHY